MVPTNYIKLFKESVSRGEPFMADNYGEPWVLKQWFCYIGDLVQFGAHCNPENKNIRGEWRIVEHEETNSVRS